MNDALTLRDVSVQDIQLELHIPRSEAARPKRIALGVATHEQGGTQPRKETAQQAKK